MNNKETLAIVWIICSHCSQYHLLQPGLDKPYYWCGDEILTLAENDEVLIKDALYA